MVLIIINFIVRMTITITKMMLDITINIISTDIIIIIITMIIQIKITGRCAISSLEREDLPLFRSNLRVTLTASLLTYQHYSMDSC